MEDYKVEYKIDIPEKHNKLKAEIVAFLNSKGGEIYLGVDDAGIVNKTLISEKKQEWEEVLSNWLVNAFSPDITNLVSIYPNELPFRIKVMEGPDKPYFYKDGDGFNSKGVYIRIGSTKRVASFDEIQRMIRQHKSNDFESISILQDDLTFKYIENRFKEKGIIFDKYALSLINKDGKYNNAALLFSDQNPTVSKFAVFQGNDVSVFLDKKEFSGSVLKQLDDILFFCNLSNKKRITISGKPERDEYLDIPPRALREAIVNCYCHRDYTLSGDIKIEFYDDRVQIFSPGSLPDGLTFENIKMGMVAKRNKIVVTTLDKIDIIENYASGVRRIFQDYADFTKQPEYYISNNGVIVTLYNRNYNGQNDGQNDGQKQLVKLTMLERREKILQLVIENNRITSNKLKDVLGVSKATIERDISKLREEGKLEYTGSSKNGYWKIKEI